MAKKKKARSRSSSASNDGCTQYAIDVTAGKIVAGPYVRQACKRHIADLGHQKETGLEYREEIANRAVEFFAEVLTVEQGEEVAPFLLEPFQRFIVGSLFGWYNADGTRRFKTAYIEIGKGNGKTPLAAGIGHYGLVADGCMSPEIYCAATMMDQAKIAWNDAKVMAQRSPALSDALEVGANAIRYPENNGVFRAVSSEHKGLDGKRVHMALIDEVHEHPTPMVCDKMKKGTKKDLNALIVEITNSGYDLESVCYKHHEYSLGVLDGMIQDNAWFGYVCALDEKDDWMNDESCWIKTNPGLGTILPIQYLRKEVNEAKGMPSQRNIAARLNFCVWTQQHEIWIPIEKWEDNDGRYTDDSLLGEPVWVGMDLSDKLDLSVVVGVFKRPIADKSIEIKVGARENPSDLKSAEIEKSINIDFAIDIKALFFIPEETMYAREKEDRIPYSKWVEDGYVIATPGTVIDYDFIFQTICDWSRAYSIQQIGYDPRGATQLAVQLAKEGFEMVELTQGYNNMSEPSQIFEALIYANRVRHNGNPVLRWNVQNAAVKPSKDNRMIIPYKTHRTKRIDGVTGVVMALGRAMVSEPEGFTLPSYATVTM